MEPFKTFISPELVRWLGHHIARALPGFDRAGYERDVFARLGDLELKARAQHIADILHVRLPQDPARRAGILCAILHPDEFDHANQPSDDKGICGWGILPLTLLVGQHGAADFDRSMELLREMTKRFSSEFGIRYLILADQPRALRHLSAWAGDPNRHVRRLASEGSRPRLPWGMRLPRLIADPSPMLPILTRLRDDPEEYVRRSVANHLNDIAKDHPALVARLAAEWSEGAPPERRALLKHALRSLIKAGDPAALAVFGQSKPEVALSPLRLSGKQVAIGGELAFEIDLRSTARKAQALTIDYLVHYNKANGRLAPKVFKGGVMTLAPGEEKTFRRIHRFREVTTRRHYPGGHAISLRINGEDTEAAEFTLKR